MHNKLKKLLISIFILFLASFLAFVQIVNNLDKQLAKKQQKPPADGIIVLTGGHNRLKLGMQLLRQQPQARMLLSGVNEKLSNSQLFKAMHITDPGLIERIDIGRKALNTAGNAIETAYWVSIHNYKHIYIVTNDYHMPRSIIEMRILLPNTDIIEYPVKDKIENWKKIKLRIYNLILEFFKYIKANIKYYYNSLTH